MKKAEESKEEQKKRTERDAKLRQEQAIRADERQRN